MSSVVCISGDVSVKNIPEVFNHSTTEAKERAEVPPNNTALDDLILLNLIKFKLPNI